MTDDARILFVHLHPSTFVRSDLEILRGAFDVRELRLRSPIQPAPWRIVREVARCDLVFCWFASWHAVLPLAAARLLGKPSILVIGGYDVANVPEIGYGHQRGGLRKWVAGFAMRAATRLCAFSRSAQREAETNAGIPGHRISMIHLGVDVEAKEADEQAQVPREPIVLTIGNVNRSNLRRKGLDRFARASRAMPELAFVIAGAIQDDAGDEIARLGSSDLRLTGQLSDDELRLLCRRASAYLQLSMHEGFGLAVVEAMREGCVPVVTRVGSLPEIVGDAGEYVDDPAPEAVAAAVRRVLSDPARGRQASERVRALFSLAKRRQELLALVRSTLRSPRPA